MHVPANEKAVSLNLHRYTSVVQGGDRVGCAGLLKVGLVQAREIQLTHTA